MMIAAIVLHQFLGWPLLAGVVIAAAIATVPGLVQLFAQVNADNRFAVFGIALQAIAGTVIGMVLTYVPMVLVYFLTGHPSW